MAEEVNPERAELRTILEAMAEDHIMSFVHTPGFRDEIDGKAIAKNIIANDPEMLRVFRIDEDDDEAISEKAEQYYPELLHDMRLKQIDLAVVRRKPVTVNPSNIVSDYTALRMNLNLAKAMNLRGKTVIPTGDQTTLAFFLKGNAASTDDTHGRGNRPTKASGYSKKSNETGRDILLEMDRDVGIDLLAQEFEFGGAVKDDDGDVLEFKLITSFAGSPVEANIWFPDLYADGSLPAGIPKEVKERLKNLRDDPIFSPLKRERDETKRRTPIGKKAGISPITAYYIMRYLSPFLLQSGQVSEALPRGDGTARRITVKRNTLDQYALDEMLNSLLVGETLDRNIDEMFPFEPIRTRYRYPDDYPANYLSSFGKTEVRDEIFDSDAKEIYFIRCPRPRDEGVSNTIKYGLLQKIHAIMSPSRRRGMINDIYDVFVAGSENISTPIYAITGGGSLSASPETNYIPSAKNGQSTFDYAEVLLALIDADFRGLAKEDTMQLLTNREEGRREHISEGATLIVPGLLILYAEESNSHSLFDITYGLSTKSVITNSGRRLNNTDGFDYLEALVDFCQEEPDIEDKNAILNDIVSSEYECVFQPGKETSKLVILGENDIQLTVTVNNRRLKNGIREKDVNRRLNFDEDGDPKYTGADLDYLVNLNYNSEYQDDDGDFLSLEAFAETTGEIIKRASPYGAEAFNALGYIVEEGMVNSAVLAVDSVEGFSASTDFDKIVIGLIGTQQYPGLATVHAAYHYQYLFQQMISPVKNWNVVDSELFTQGTFLALESFFDKPAIKALYYMLNQKGYITLGNNTDDFTFFSTPRPMEFNQAAYTGLQNGFAQMVIGYYRLLFAQIRNRLVIARDTKEARKLDETTADIRTLWKNLIVDSMDNTPDPKMFALVLRFLAEETVDSVIKIPTWMPVLPEDMNEAKRRASNENEPSQYLKWAYGSNAVDLEFFAEVAAAYHSAKALSYFEDYPAMVRRFVEAVDEDSGHAFLFSILLSNEQPDLTPDAVTGKAVTITNFDIMDGVEVPKREQSEGSDSPASLDVGGGDAGGPPTEEVTVPTETRGDPPESPKDRRAQELWGQIKKNSADYVNGETETDAYGENITQLINEWFTEFEDLSIEVVGPAGNRYEPVRHFFDNNFGKTVMGEDGEEMFDPELLTDIATLFSASEVAE